jgi:hypothetical protein
MEPTPLTTQQQNAVSKWIASLKILYDAAFQLKSDRAVLDLLGVSALPADAVFPGDLGHITSARVTAGLQAMNVLDAALISPAQIKDAEGTLIATILPIKAIVELLR